MKEDKQTNKDIIKNVVSNNNQIIESKRFNQTHQFKPELILRGEDLVKIFTTKAEGNNYSNSQYGLFKLSNGTETIILKVNIKDLVIDNSEDWILKKYKIGSKAIFIYDDKIFYAPFTFICGFAAGDISLNQLIFISSPMGETYLNKYEGNKEHRRTRLNKNKKYSDLVFSTEQIITKKTFHSVEAFFTNHKFKDIKKYENTQYFKLGITGYTDFKKGYYTELFIWVPALHCWVERIELLKCTNLNIFLENEKYLFEFKVSGDTKTHFALWEDLVNFSKGKSDLKTLQEKSLKYWNGKDTNLNNEITNKYTIIQ